MRILDIKSSRWEQLTTSWVAVRLILLPVCVVLCGCTSSKNYAYTHFLFHEGETQIGLVPQDPGTNFVLRAALPRGATYITLRCASGASPEVNEKTRLTMLASTEKDVAITLANRSTSSKSQVILYGNRAVETNVAPQANAELYNGSLKALLAGRQLTLQTSYRTSCELHFHFSPAPKFTGPVRVVCHYAYGGVG